jgi:NAD(P)-dependent dehydrogenase (short-subunit alcohol dehydrogenase family)
MSLAGKVAVVTGGAGSIGGATALRLSREGCSVVVVDVDDEGAARVADSLPGPALACAADVADEAQVALYIEAAVERFGRVDLHHLNAGIPDPFVSLEDLTVEAFDRVMAINVRGVFLGLRAAFRRYAVQDGGGAIVITASIASLRGSDDLLAYHTSKHAVLGLMRNGAVHGGPLGVRVNAVAPGIIPTPLFAAAGPGQEGGADDMEKRATTTPLRRAGRADEVAAVVAFLLGDDASYLTGEVISVDGGATTTNTLRPSGGAGRWTPPPPLVGGA